MKARTKSWVVTVLCLLGLVGVLAGTKAGQIIAMMKAGEAFTPPPETVSSARVEAADWEETTRAIGSLVAVRGVTLAAELPGLVREIGFDSGTAVRQGVTLVRFDTSTEEAQLDAALADASLAGISLGRARQLRSSGTNTPADLDAAVARAREAEARVAGLRATIAKKTIRAPFDGRISIRQVELGQVLSPGDPVASLQSVSPIQAEFWLPQQALGGLRLGQRVRLLTDAFPGSHWEGELTTINPEIDVATRNLRVRATVPNPDGRLRPGMYVNLEVLAAEKRPVLIVPETAVIYAPYGDSVFVLEEKPDRDGKTGTVAVQRFVRLGERRGDFVVVTSGVSAGETVVGSGAFKLRNGSAVVVNNDLAPDPRIAPKPSQG